MIDRLAEAPETIPLFQAVRLLEQAARVGAASPKGADQPVGQDAHPPDEVVRFRAANGLGFPSSDLQRVQLAADELPPEDTAVRRQGLRQPELSVNAIGLTGPSGVLPQGYTEIMARSLRERSFAMRDFFDMFNHRITALFYRAWTKYRLPFSFERNGGRGNDGVTQLLAGLVGLGTPRTRRRHAAADEAILHYAGLFAHWPRSIVGLEAMLSDYLGRPVVADQFCGRWLMLPADVQSRLAGRGPTAGFNCQLGLSALAGTRAWDVQSTIRLRIGPLRGSMFADLLPGGAAFERLRDLVRLYLGLECSCRLQLTLARDAVPNLSLDGQVRLGLNSWLKSGPMAHDSSDAEFALV
ncbi:MAG: type VI secretion system baseplate subunit TssG [Alphaproteobacteria bacterium]